MTDAELIASLRERWAKVKAMGIHEACVSPKPSALWNTLWPNLEKILSLASRGAAVVENRERFEFMRNEISMQMADDESPHRLSFAKDAAALDAILKETP